MYCQLQYNALLGLDSWGHRQPKFTTGIDLTISKDLFGHSEWDVSLSSKWCSATVPAL